MIKLNTKKYTKAGILLFFILSLFQSYLIASSCTDSERVTLTFWGDSTDMYLPSEQKLRDAIRTFKSNRLSFIIEGKSSFSLEDDSIGISRAETIRKFLMDSGISSSDIKVLNHKRGHCEILVGRSAPKSSSSSSCNSAKNPERVTINFWGGSTDMFGGENSKLRGIVDKFRWKGQNFEIEGKSSFMDSDDIAIHRAEIIKSFLMDSGINSRDIKILSTKNGKCLIQLGSR
ncbi:MAG: hypothetical protein C5B43_01830 [Verrucomicrobia bacterium]|nr:MAG: hypothetical protein C5B43_01830 [Verrucomicrobiota bacterium]